MNCLSQKIGFCFYIYLVRVYMHAYMCLCVCICVVHPSCGFWWLNAGRWAQWQAPFMRGVILLAPHCFLYITNEKLKGEAFQVSMWDRQWNLLTVQSLGYCTWGPVRGETSESAGHTLSRNHFLGPLGLHVQGLGHHGVNFTSHLRIPSLS